MIRKKLPARAGYVEDYAREQRDQYTIATCFEGVEHLYSPASLFESVHSLLRSRGKFIVTTPNAFNAVRALKFVLAQRHHDPLLDPTVSATPEHIRLWSASMLVRAFSNAGFVNVRRYAMMTAFGAARGYPRKRPCRILVDQWLRIVERVVRERYPALERRCTTPVITPAHCARSTPVLPGQPSKPRRPSLAWSTAVAESSLRWCHVR